MHSAHGRYEQSVVRELLIFSLGALAVLSGCGNQDNVPPSSMPATITVDRSPISTCTSDGAPTSVRQAFQGRLNVATLAADLGVSATAAADGVIIPADCTPGVNSTTLGQGRGYVTVKDPPPGISPDCIAVAFQAPPATPGVTPTPPAPDTPYSLIYAACPKVESVPSAQEHGTQLAEQAADIPRVLYSTTRL